MHTNNRRSNTKLYQNPQPAKCFGYVTQFFFLNCAVFTQQTNNLQLLFVCCVKTAQFKKKIVICTQRDGNNQIQICNSGCLQPYK